MSFGIRRSFEAIKRFVGLLLKSVRVFVRVRAYSRRRDLGMFVTVDILAAESCWIALII